MKKNSIYILFLTALISLGSCKKLTDDLNIDPNRPTDAPADLLLNGTEVASIIAYEGNLARVGGIFSNSFTGADRQYTLLNSYVSTAPDYDDGWDNLYATVIAQAIIGERKSSTVNNRLMVGIFQVLQAQGFGFAADMWGDVPFSQVGDETNYPQPKFDAQADVYAGVQSILDKAIANLNSGVGVTPGAKDFYFQGSAAKWVQTAYTLKARFYLHTKDYASAITAAQNGISSATNNMMAPHGGTYLSDFNVFYSFLTYDRVAYMDASDAEAPKFLDPASSLYRGNSKTNEEGRFGYLYQEGLNTGGLDPNVLVAFDWGNDPSEDGFFGASTSFPLVTYAENNLILAEAQLKGSNNLIGALAALNVHRLYMNGGGYINSGYVEENSYLPYLLTDFLPGGIENAVGSGQTQAQALLREILEERYVTFIGQLEQFNDVRRTKNYLGITLKNTSSTKLPQRFLYPQSEINTNPNTPKLGSTDLFRETTINLTAY